MRIPQSHLTRAVAATALLLAVCFRIQGAGAAEFSHEARVASPDGSLVAVFGLTTTGEPRYRVERAGEVALGESKLGLIRDDADFTKGLEFIGSVDAGRVVDEYEIVTAKRRHNRYEANRTVVFLKTASGKTMDVVFQVSNDGVAFRYRFAETDTATRRISEEATSFRLQPGALAWLQPKQVAKTGFEGSNPAYEEYYQKEVPVGAPSPMAGWVFPALFRSGETWLLLSETALDRSYCGSSLQTASPDGEYKIAFPDEREGFPGGAVYPESTLPWSTPWRLIVVGDLKTIAESTLGIDLAKAPQQPVVTAGSPGRASWSWPLLGDGSAVYDVQKRFIDYAADMGWEYTLIDALWDTQIGYEKVEELIDYAATKGVKILLWYNSAGPWNTTPQTPRNRMMTRESRIQEFMRLKKMGVAGLKIDFFAGDGQSMIAYYQDILDDAAQFGLQINFHGSTLPRGWQRTYPNLMTMEAIKGQEFITFFQGNADEEPTHATMLPFTRNVFDPMDFTPMVLDRMNNIERRTTSAFELALTVLFTSGIQHYVEIPEGMAKAPDYVKDFLRGVPSTWEDVRFIDGYPGKYVVIARKGGGKWYVAGINGGDEAREVSVDLDSFAQNGTGNLITDGSGGNLSFKEKRVRIGAREPLNVEIAPRGGFVLVVE